MFILPHMMCASCVLSLCRRHGLLRKKFSSARESLLASHELEEEDNEYNDQHQLDLQYDQVWDTNVGLIVKD